MSGALKTYGRRRGAAVTFNPSCTPVSNVFTSSSGTSSSTGKDCSDGSDSPPEELRVKCAAIAHAPSHQGKQSKQKPKLMDSKRVGTVSRGQKRYKPPLRAQLSSDSSSSPPEVLYSQPKNRGRHRQPLADLNGTAFTCEWSAKKRPRCKRSVKSVAAVAQLARVANVPDFSDIENYSLYICDSSSNALLKPQIQLAYRSGEQPMATPLLNVQKVLTRSQTAKSDMSTVGSCDGRSCSLLPASSPLLLSDCSFECEASRRSLLNRHSHSRPASAIAGMTVSTPHSTRTGSGVVILDSYADVSAIEDMDEEMSAIAGAAVKGDRLASFTAPAAPLEPFAVETEDELAMLSHNLSEMSVDRSASTRSGLAWRDARGHRGNAAVTAARHSRSCASAHSALAASQLKLESIVEANHDESSAELESASTGMPEFKSASSPHYRCSGTKKSLSDMFPLTTSPPHSSGELYEACEPSSPHQLVLEQCCQEEYISFSHGLQDSDCVKIGEGVYGEVFRAHDAFGISAVLKIIPVEGNFHVNDELQKTFAEILPEIVISRELSELRHSEINSCENFIEVLSVSCVQGAYPKHLLEQWDEYDAKKTSENDCPEVFGPNQLFIIFAFEDGGADLEKFEFASMRQGLSVLRQVAWALAVAESVLKFEHRDLHWGNVLVKKVEAEATAMYRLYGQEFHIACDGVFASIIDFTLSRLEKDERVLYLDLSQDKTLFQGTGDYQFDIYRKMKEDNEGEWRSFNAYTNVLWLHYLATKLVKAKKYPRCSAAKRRSDMRQLRDFLATGLQFASALDLVISHELFACSIDACLSLTS